MPCSYKTGVPDACYRANLLSLNMKSSVVFATAILAWITQFAIAAPSHKACNHKKHNGSCICPNQSGPLQASQPSVTPEPFSKNPLFGTPCDTEGQLQCLGADFGQCNYGKWHVIDCLNDSACVPNDYQCVPLSDWDRVNEQVNGQNQTLNSPAPTPVPTFSQNPLYGTACDTNGEMKCLGKDFGTCNQGVWHVVDCLNDSTCIPNDYQCVPSSDWDRVNQQVNGGSSGLQASNPGSSSCTCQIGNGGDTDADNDAINDNDNDNDGGQ